MAADPLDPRATDADSLLRQERSEPVAIPIDGALRALQDVANTAIEHGASVPFAICLTNAIDRLRLAIERARANHAEVRRVAGDLCHTYENGTLGDVFIAGLIEELRDALKSTPTPHDTAAALADIAARVLALPHGAAPPSVCLGGNGAAFDALRAVDGCTITEHPDEDEPPFRPECRSCRVTVGGVEFYAIDRRPR